MSLIATKKVFDQAGVLRSPGEQVVFEKSPKKEQAKREPRDRGVTSGSPLDRPVVEVAAIGPTGPAPVEPQQLPPGSTQTLSGYVGPDGEKLVAEGADTKGLKKK